LTRRARRLLATARGELNGLKAEETLLKGQIDAQQTELTAAKTR
jgi:hypothetical protein